MEGSDGTTARQFKPYTLVCDENGCKHKFVVNSASFEANSLNFVIEQHYSSKHRPAEATPAERKRDKADDVNEMVPIVNKGLHEMSKEEWRVWRKEWSMYRCLQPAGLNLNVKILSRFPKIRGEIAETVDLAKLSEELLLAEIQKLAVRETNVIRMRQSMRKLEQAHSESISAFAHRLDKAALVCDFIHNVKCKHCGVEDDYSYTEEEVRDTFFCGLYDKDILEKLCLIFKKRVPKLAEIVQEAESIESSRIMAAKPTEGTVAAMSTYKKNTRTEQQRPADTKKMDLKCHNCDGVGHMARYCRKENPHKGYKCANCGRMNHHESKCRKRAEPATTTAQPQQQPQPQPGSTNLITTSVVRNDEYILQVADVKDKKSVPRIRVTLGYAGQRNDDKAGPTSTVSVNGLADTGASSCVINESVWRRMGFSNEQLSPSSMKLGAANSTNIPVLGEATVRITVDDSPDNSTTTTAAVCACTNEDIILSKAVLMELKIVHEDFPSVISSTEGISSVDETSCPCIPRTTAPPPPPAPPVPLQENNREQIEKYLLEYYASSTFNNCTHQPLPGMDGEPLRVHINKDMPPTAVNRPSTVSVHWEKQVKAALEADVRLGVIERVPCNTPQLWCAPMHVVAKHNGDPRRVVDFTKLNEACSRQTHIGGTPFDLANKVPAGRLMSTMDCWNGFHSVPVHPDDYHYFTFVTPWGRYRYKMAPQGWLASGDAYTHRYDQITSDIDRHIKVIDDSLLWSNDIHGAWTNVTNFLSTVGRRGVILNAKKFHFAERTAEFAGFQLGDGAIKPLEKHVTAIRDFPEPRSLTDMRSFFALCEQVSYAYTIKEQLNPFRELVKTKDKKFFWDEQLSKLFIKTRNEIADKVCEGIMRFDPKKVTTVETDWSKEGVGYWLRQKHCTCPQLKFDCCRDGWQVSMCGSRFCSQAESRYSPVEGELLAVTWALKKTRIFTLGATNLFVVTDHKPLVGLIKGVEKAENRRLTRLRGELTGWSIRDVWYRAGKRNAGPDAFSRSPAGVNILTERNTKRISLLQVQQVTEKDETLQLVIQYVRTAFPATRAELPTAAREFWNARIHLNERRNLLYFGDRVVIPKQLRKEVLDNLHIGHQGVTSMILRAQSSLFWPGIQADIQRKRDSCISCMESAPSNSALPPRPPVRPEYPFQSICIDYCFHAGHKYGVMVDRFSNWPCVWKASKKSVVEWLTSFCARFGIPEEISSDGGPEFTSGAMQELMKDFGINHRKSSAYHPHSNLRAELGVKDVKRMLRENVDSDGSINNSRMTAALLTYKNTPDRDTRMSPAEYVFGRKMNDMLPTGSTWTDSFGDDWKRTMAARELAVASRHERCHDKLSEHTKELPPLDVGDHVAVQNQHGNSPLKWDRRGVIVSVEPYDKYAVKILGSGRLTYRNRQHLRKYLPQELEYSGHDRSEGYLSDTAVNHGTQFDAEKRFEPEVSRPEPPHRTVNADPVTQEPEIQEPDTRDQQPEQPPAPTPPATTTVPSPRRSMRSTAGKTSKYDEYIQTIMNLANILCSELPHHARYLGT